MPYSDIVLEHFRAPRNMRVMEKPDAVGVAGEPGHGNFMVIYLRLQGGRIAEATYQTHGCCPSIAAGSWLTNRLRGVGVGDARDWSAPRIEAGLGGLPPHKAHCAFLAETALRRALEGLDRTESTV